MAHAETERDRLPRLARVAGGWTGLRAWGVEADDTGALRLSRLPDAGTPAAPSVAFDPLGPGGLAVGTDGFGFVSDPTGSRLLRFTPCDPVAAADVTLRLAAADTEFCPGRFGTPRGLALGPRGRLYVADAAAGAVLVLDPQTGASLGSWPRVAPTQVLAGADQLLVLDRGGTDGRGRIAAFDADGGPDTSFVPPALHDPVRIASAGPVLLVLDHGDDVDQVVLLNSSTGEEAGRWTPVREDPTTGRSSVAVDRATGLAATAERAFLVDAARADLLSFTLTGEFVGSVKPVEPVDGVLAVGGSLWTAPLAGGAWLRHDPVGRSRAAGAFTCGPLDTATATARRELHARMVRLGGQHVRLWTTVQPPGVVPDPSSLPLGPDPSPDGMWTAAPADVAATLLPQPSGPLVFIGAELSGDGTSSPVVHQLSIGGGGGWLDLLPAIYRKDPLAADFLDRLLRLVQSVAEETEVERRGLVARFDAWAASDDPIGGSPLDELAAWVATTLDERWAEPARRRVVAGAHTAQALRGTPLGLADAIEERFGVRPRITSAAQQATVWSLGSGGLGFTSMLAAAPPEGSVLGAGAAVNGSHLTGGERPGAPLFADLAHRFSVQVPAAPVDANGGEPALRRLIDAERPAHTAYTLCLVGPHARVGVQSRVGVDLVVAGDPPSLRLDAEAELGAGMLPGRQARVGSEALS